MNNTNDGLLGQCFPDRETFRALATTRRVIPVTTKLIADGFTPVSLYTTLAGNKPGTFLFESAEQGQSWSRWSFVGCASPAILTDDGGAARWLGSPPVWLPQEGDTLAVLASSLQLLYTEPLDNMPPLTGGLVGYLGYDCVFRLNDIATDPAATAQDDIHLPDLVMMLTQDIAALDHHEGSVTLIANAINADGTDAGVDSAYDAALERIAAMKSALANPTTPPVASYSTEQIPVSHRSGSGDYEEAVRQAQRHIAAGEATQVVISQRFDVDVSQEPDEATLALRTYRALRATNPSPYMYLLNLPTPTGDTVRIAGSSPEALVTVRERVASMHPIAGTRPRGAHAAADIALEKELLADEKERSEHQMLVDLGRSDLGTVCEASTIAVPEYFAIERFSHVMHIVSTVTGTLLDECSALDAIAACFPAGTLTGAPKVRAVEIIDQLEPVRRGPYGGLVGYLDFGGDADVAIAIRTAVIARGWAHIQAGAGVVAQSVPATENQECRNKAAAVLAAVSAAMQWRESGGQQ